jgi:hypothetical protein
MGDSTAACIFCSIFSRIFRKHPIFAVYRKNETTFRGYNPQTPDFVEVITQFLLML